MSLFLLLLLAAVVLGLIGAVVHGPGRLLAVGAVLLVAAPGYGLWRLRGRARPVR